MSSRTRTLGLAAIAVVTATAPIGIHPQNLVSGGPVFRLQDACGQATECQSNSLYICSTVREDHRGYKCSAGCGTSFIDGEGLGDADDPVAGDAGIAP